MKTSGYCWYSNDSVSGPKSTYGALYNWFAAESIAGKGKNLCPAGWHVPTDEEWTALTSYIAENNKQDVGDQLKSRQQVHSLPDEPKTKNKHPRWGRDELHHGTDDYGFSALPAGARHVTGKYYGLGTGAYWWSSTSYYSTASWARHIYNDSGNVDHTFGSKRMGFSIRCIRD